MGGYLSTAIIGLGVMNVSHGKLSNSPLEAKGTGRPRRWTHWDFTISTWLVDMSHRSQSSRRAIHVSLQSIYQTSSLMASSSCGHRACGPWWVVTWDSVSYVSWVKILDIPSGYEIRRRQQTYGTGMSILRSRDTNPTYPTSIRFAGTTWTGW